MVVVPAIDGVRTQAITLGGEPLTLRELSARDLISIWSLLSEGETSGNMTDAYLRVVRLGTFLPGGEPKWDSPEALGHVPARIVVDLAERILDMSEVQTETSDPPNPTQAPKT